jgi:hypothetical protein
MSVAWTVKQTEVQKHSLFRVGDIKEFIQDWLTAMSDSWQGEGEVIVFGYNSSKFDVVVFMPYVSSERFKIVNVVGSTTHFKCFIVEDKTKKLSFKFIDLLGFLAGGSLAENAKAFAPESVRQKGHLPYELLTCDNYIEELSKLKLFEQSDFDNTLKNKKMTNKEYKEYKKEAEGMTRLEYLLYYNERDTEIMIPLIDTLIQLFWNNSTPDYKWLHNGIDMLKRLSLSACASSVKYALAYTLFDMYANYIIPTREKPYGLKPKYWEWKWKGYLKQDINRFNNHPVPGMTKEEYTKHNLCEADFPWAHEEFRKGCYICHCKFNDNLRKPTFDRIDNSLPHTKANVKPCCIRCNKFKSDHDVGFATLLIQLENYAQLHGLPAPLIQGEELVYWDLMKCKTGGLSIVHNRIDRANIDKIRRLKVKYLNDNPKPRGKDVEVFAFRTENVNTHVFGVDFNNLYPTSFASMSLPYFDIRNAVVNNLNVDCSGELMMPGSYVETLTNSTTMAEFMTKRNKVGFISVEGFKVCPPDHYPPFNYASELRVEISEDLRPATDFLSTGNPRRVQKLGAVD